MAPLSDEYCIKKKKKKKENGAKWPFQQWNDRIYNHHIFPFDRVYLVIYSVIYSVMRACTLTVESKKISGNAMDAYTKHTLADVREQITSLAGILHRSVTHE